MVGLKVEIKGLMREPLTVSLVTFLRPQVQSIGRPCGLYPNVQVLSLLTVVTAPT